MKFTKEILDALKMWNNVNPFVRCMLGLLYFMSYGVPPKTGVVMFVFITILSIAVGIFEYVRITEEQDLYT